MAMEVVGVQGELGKKKTGLVRFMWMGWYDDVGGILEDLTEVELDSCFKQHASTCGSPSRSTDSISWNKLGCFFAISGNLSIVKPSICAKRASGRMEIGAQLLPLCVEGCLATCISRIHFKMVRRSAGGGERKSYR